MTRKEKLAKEAHARWVESVAHLAGRPLEEKEKETLGRVPFFAAFEAGFDAALNEAEQSCKGLLDTRADAWFNNGVDAALNRIRDLGEEEV